MNLYKIDDDLSGTTYIVAETLLEAVQLWKPGSQLPSIECVKLIEPDITIAQKESK